MHSRRRVSGAIVCLLMPLAANAMAEAPASRPAAASRPAIDPRADAVLRGMGTHLASIKEFTFEATNMVDQVLDDGQKVQLSDRIRFQVRRPDRVAVKATGDTRDECVWYDGKSLTFYDRQAGERASLEVPATIDKTLDCLADQYGIVMPLAELLFSDPYKAVIDNILSGSYVGLHQVDGVKCHHLAFRQALVDWQIWIEDGPTPFPRKLVITYKMTPGQPQYAALLGHWDAAANLPASAFAPEIPADAKVVEIRPAAGSPTQGTETRR